jgi:hypothetical protein
VNEVLDFCLFSCVSLLNIGFVEKKQSKKDLRLWDGFCCKQESHERFFHKEIQNYTHEKDRLQLFPLKNILKDSIRSIQKNAFCEYCRVPAYSFFFWMG